MKNGFIKVAAASPKLRVADCAYNVEEHIKLANEAADRGVKLLVFPELSISASTCGDLFLTDTLQKEALKSIARFTKETKGLGMISIIGLPLRIKDSLYNCAAVCYGGHVLRFIIKSEPSDDETRYFSKPQKDNGCINLFDDFVFIGTDFVFSSEFTPEFRFGVTIGDDRDAIQRLTSSGALIIANPIASSETVGADELRRLTCLADSLTMASGRILANADYGESTTDFSFGGHRLICENGSIIAESEPYTVKIDAPDSDRLLVSEIDVAMLSTERLKRKSLEAIRSDDAFEVVFDMLPSKTELTRRYSPIPFIKDGAGDEYAKRILSIQYTGLVKRVEVSRAKKCIIGISGGLDSTLALLVAAHAMDDLHRSRKDIIGISMPGFGTTERTKSNAEIICEEIGVTFRTIPIYDSVEVHFKDIGHDKNIHDVVFENSQARERTQVLMDIANAENGIVIGTGDMSELALGWATYNGDHMSMYGVNSSVPKTVVRYIINYCANRTAKNGKERLSKALFDILDTPVSPELLPSDGKAINQKTEDIVGPYEIQDFYLYHMLRYGFSPKKLYTIACHAFKDAFSDEVLLKCLDVFVKRFFTQQYKRSCLPDGPQVFSIGLSPRVGFRMPSDTVSALWMAEIEEIKQNI